LFKVSEKKIFRDFFIFALAVSGYGYGLHMDDDCRYDAQHSFWVKLSPIQQ
jgi:hypothetical protein